MTTADDKLDHTPLTFGKFKGKTPDEVSQTDPSYIVWCYEAWAQGGRKPPCSKLLYKACKDEEDDDFEDQPDPFGVDPNK